RFSGMSCTDNIGICRTLHSSMARRASSKESSGDSVRTGVLIISCIVTINRVLHYTCMRAVPDPERLSLRVVRFIITVQCRIELIVEKRHTQVECAGCATIQTDIRWSGRKQSPLFAQTALRAGRCV